MPRARKRPDIIERIESRIFLIRGQKVMLDSDLADLYGVSTKTLIQAVKRNVSRFPEDFMFRLELQEVAILRSQTVTSRSHGGRRYLPHAFTEQGVAMLSSVLRSERAVLVNIEIIRTFVRLRRIIESHEGLAGKLAEMEKRYDIQFRAVFEAIQELMSKEKGSMRRIGFLGQGRDE